jgi:hypothetical protein
MKVLYNLGQADRLDIDALRRLVSPRPIPAMACGLWAWLSAGSTGSTLTAALFRPTRISAQCSEAGRVIDNTTGRHRYETAVFDLDSGELVFRIQRPGPRLPSPDGTARLWRGRLTGSICVWCDWDSERPPARE